MTLSNVNPVIWAGALPLNLNDAHVYAQAFNRNYEGDIADFGDSVKINSIGRVATQTYTKNGSLTGPETLDDAQQVLLIDQAIAINFEIDDIDKRQQRPKLMRAAMVEASWALADTADAFLATTLEASGAKAN